MPLCAIRLAFLLGLSLGGPAAGVSANVARPEASARFIADRVVVPVGSHRAVALKLETPAGKGTVLEAASSDPSVIEITRQPDCHEGATVAFLRLRVLKAGTCKLTLGGASMEVIASAERAIEPRPLITGPAPGSVAWGQVAVTVSFTDQEHPERAFAGSLVLRLSDGSELKPVRQTTLAEGPNRRALFQLDTTTGRSATLEIEPVWTSSEGVESAGEPLELMVRRPSETDVLHAEAEGEYQIERPERFREPVGIGAIGTEREASGGRFLQNPGANPTFCFPVHVETAGWYQAILTARGTCAGGAYPTVGLVVDGANFPMTNARVPDDVWRRFVLGVPIQLGAGDRILSVNFENDFFARGLGDRNLALDKIEVMRVADAAPSDDAASPGGMMGAMSGGAMSGGAMMKSAMGAMNAMGAMSAMTKDAPSRSADALAADPWGLQDRPVRIAFSRPLHNRDAAGEIVIEGVSWWQPEESPAPLVTLMLNGAPYARQRAASPRFVVDPADLRPGANKVQLIAMTDAGVDATPMQEFGWTPPAPVETNASARRFVRLTVHEPGWNEYAANSMSKENGPPERRSVAFFSQAEATISLPPDLSGRFEVLVESWGREFEGHPVLAGTLIDGEQRTPIGEVKVQAWWTPRSLGTIELKPGEVGSAARKLGIAFTNDHYAVNKGDRNVWMQAVVLHEVATEDRHAPTAAILHPKPDAAVRWADAVVASFADDRGTASIELMVDGKPTGTRLDVKGRTAPLLLPLVTRSLEPGRHTLAVRVTDVSGKSTQSAPVEIQVVHDAAAAPTEYDRAVHLLNRLGFGPSPTELADLLMQGEDTWLRAALAADAEEPSDLAAMGMSLARFPHVRGEYEVSRRPIMHAGLTRNSVRARFVLWCENHFSTWIRKTEGDRKWREHVAFSRVGAGPFFDLLLTSATSPAMLRYLDQEQSYAGMLNENYAREIMELHTLGVHGGYSQTDVTSLAKLLAGWTTTREGDGMSAGETRDWSFVYDPALSASGAISVLGVDFLEGPRAERYDRVRFALEILSVHPSTASYVCRKLAEHYVSVPAPDALVNDMARRFTETGGDMTEVMLTLGQHAEFRRLDLPARLAHPMQFAVRMARTTGDVNPWAIADYMQRSGNGLFDRSTPDGYPEEDSAYVDSNSMLQRWRLAQDYGWALASLVPDPIRYGDVPKDAAEADRWMQQCIDLIAVRLTGRLLGDESNTAALNLLRSLEGNRQDRVSELGTFIAQLPEASLR